MSNLAVLYDVEWQKLRVSLLAENKEDGGFTTFEGTLDNIEQLGNYCEQVMTDEEGWEDEYLKRLYRCLNLLNAVRMGYSGQGLKGSQQDDFVRRIRDSYSWSYKRFNVDSRLGVLAWEWDWDKVDQDLAELVTNDRESFDRIYDNLKKRLVTAEKRRGEKKDVADTRRELVRFIELMEDYR